MTLSWPAGSQPIWDSVTVALLAFGLALPTVGGGDALTRLAHEFPAPRLGVLRRTARIVMSLVAVGTVLLLTIAFLVLVPADSRAGWADIPLAGLIRDCSTPGWVRGVLQAGLGVTTLLFLVPAIQACMVDAGQLLRRLAAAGVLPEGLAMPHPRLGTLTKSLDVVTAASVLLGAGQRRPRRLAGWRLRRGHRRYPGPARPGHRTAAASGCGGPPGAGAGSRPVETRRSDWPDDCRLGHGHRHGVHAGTGRRRLARGVRADAASAPPVQELDSRRTKAWARRKASSCSPPPRLPSKTRCAQPGNILVPVRNPHALAHVAAALQAAAIATSS